MPNETAPMRSGEEIGVVPLGAYLRSQPGFQAAGDIEIEQFPGGHSNLTYLVRVGDCEFVLRRPPVGPVAPKAHDMAREYRFLEALGPLFPRAPRVVLLCEDSSVIGVPFFLMERRCGLVLRNTVPGEFATHPDVAARVSKAFIHCLADLHAVDLAEEKLRSLGKPDGYLARQVRGWCDRWWRAQTSRVSAVDEVLVWLAAKIPQSPPPAVVHNDFKLDNMMLAEDCPDRIVAVLDWEMATLGDPLSDLGLALTYWCHAGVPSMSAAVQANLTKQPGWWQRERLIEEYQQRTGRDCAGIAYYEVFGVFKLAVILQQIYYRYVHGQTQDERFREFGQVVAELGDVARRLVEQTA